MKSTFNSKSIIPVFLLLFLFAGSVYNLSLSKNPVREKNEHARGKTGRGLIAVPTDDGNVYLGWRLLANDPENIAFNIYRHNDSGTKTKINDDPVRYATNYIDENVASGVKVTYTIRPVVNGKEREPTDPCPIVGKNNNGQPYLKIGLQGNYDFQKVGIADLDGKGKYDYVIKQPNVNNDPWYKYWNPSEGTYKLEAYRHDGKHLWTHDLGWAIERGIWYSPYLVYDFNGDGKAEVAVKTGEGDPRNEKGKVVSGQEYLTILDGMTGKIITQADWIPREPFFEINPDHGYNYASRNQLGIAYLDGEHPHLIVERGTYNLMIVKAYRLIDGELDLVWEWDNRNSPDNYWGQGAHWLHSADVDGDGSDEIILGSSVLDNDGTELWSTGLGHPDHCYVGDFDPDNKGLEIYYGIETRKPNGNGMCLVDASTGQILWGIDVPTEHVHGKGLCSDIDPVHPGREFYSAESVPGEGKRLDFAIMHNNKGEIINREVMGGFSPLAVHWDSDNQRELLVDGRVFDYPNNHTHINLQGSVIAIADLFGDWREEIITCLKGEMRIYTSTIPSDDRRNCLMQDHIYRIDVAHAAMGYESVPTTTYDLPFEL